MRCRSCEQDLPSEAFAKNQRACRECQRAYYLANKDRNREKNRLRWKKYDANRAAAKVAAQRAERESDPQKFIDRNLRSKYGISLDEQRALIAEQSGRCGICSCELGERFHQDHDHVTKQHRGVLCQNCNHLIGHFKDDINRIAAAIGYLRLARAYTVGRFAGRAALALLASDHSPDTVRALAVRQCPGCERPRDLREFIRHRGDRLGSQGVCRECRTPRVERSWEQTLLQETKFGILTWEQLALDALSGNECAICTGPDPHRAVLHTDHCHSTGLVRGLLCGPCNRGLGACDDEITTLMNAAMYLRRWSSVLPAASAA